MNIVETIKKSTLFHSVDMQTIEALAKECHKKTCTKGRDIFAMGDKADAFFIILEGWVKLYRISKDGEEAIIHVFGPGEDSRFALRMLGAIAARQHYLVQQIEQVTTRTAPQRIGAFLIRFCKKNKQAEGEWVVHLPYDKSVISTRMNIKPETFSRALAKLEPYGVHIEKKNILITDMEALAEFCDISPNEIPC